MAGLWRLHNVSESADFEGRFSSLTIENGQPCSLAVMTVIIDDPDEAYTFAPRQEITTSFNSTLIHAGDVSGYSRADTGHGPPRNFKLTVQDYTARLSWDVITSNRRVSESVHDRVLWIMGFSDHGIGTTGVASISDEVDPLDSDGMTVMEALEQTAGEVSASFYVDMATKELQFFVTPPGGSAPYDIRSSSSGSWSSADPPIANFALDYDIEPQATAVYVKGADFSLWRTDATAISNWGRIETAIIDPSIKAVRRAQRVGDAALQMLKDPIVTGSVDVETPGVLPMQTIHVDHPSHDVDDDFIVTRTQISLVSLTKMALSIEFADRFTACHLRSPGTGDLARTDTTDPSDPTSTPCDECQRRVVLTAIDSAISMTSSANGNIHLYDGTKLVKYSCSLDIIDSNDSAATTLGYIRHEPGTHTNLSTGDEGLYGDPSQGDYGTAVYDISGDITPISVDVSDRTTFWVTTGVGGASELDEEFTGGGSTDDWGSGLSTRWIGEITSGTPTWGVASGAGWVQGGTGDTSVALNAYTRHGTVDVDWPDTYVNNNGGGGGASTDHTGWPTDSAWTQTDWEMEARFRVIDKTADTAIWLLNYKGFGAASANNNSVYIEPDGGEYSIVDKGGGLASTTITLTDSAWYGIRWQRIGAHARVRIWLHSGAEPSSWDLDVAKGSTVYSDFQLDHIVFDDARVEWDYIRFFYAADGGLEYRSEEDGTLLASATLAVAPESSRRTPDGQHIFVQQGTDTLVRYNRNLELEDTVTVSGFFPVQDWNCDDQFNLERMSGNVLYRYHADGSLAWSTDLNAAEGYRFPSLAPSGGNGLQVYTGRSSGNGAMADGYIRVVGYRGGATWTTGESDAMLLIIRRSDGNVEDVRRWGGLAGDHAQAMAIVAHGSCIYIAGAASGAEFEQLSLSGTQGWVLRAPLGLTGADGGVAGAGVEIAGEL